MTEDTLHIPTEIGGYPVETLIGAGGQSEVFAVAGRENESRLALKWSREQYTPAWSDPLAEEYRTLCALAHPQLVKPHDFGYHDRRAFMVIDRIDGPPLFEGLQGKTTKSLWTLFKAICPILSFLHHRGVVHRDLKPDNFRWSIPPGGSAAGADNPHLYLLDLGLVSRPRDPAAEGRAGTLFYMAPEILKEGKVDARSDLYSLGIILYQWLTGTPPFPGPEPADIIDGHLSASVHWPEALPVEADQRVRAIVERLLAKNPDERPADIEEVIAGFAEAGFPAATSFPAAANISWHRQSTARKYPPVDFPVALGFGTLPKTHITVAGDPGSGITNLSARWQQELAVHGWSVDADESAFRAGLPDAAESVITVSTMHDPIAGVPGDEATGINHYLVLRPLDDDVVAEYLGSIFFDSECVDQLLPNATRLSSGLPEALDILLTEWLADGVISHKHGRWNMDREHVSAVASSDRLRALYRPALDDLTANQRRCLGYAAVFGPQVSVTLLYQLLKQDEIPAAVVDELFTRGLFVPETEAAEPLIYGRFRLSGTAEVWAADLPPEHRCLLHERIAAALHELRKEWGRTVDRRLAHHYRESKQPRRTYDAAIAWAEYKATAEGADEARRYLDLAENAVREFAPDPAWSEPAARIAFLRGRVFKASGIHESAQVWFRRVFAITRKTGNLRLQAEAAKHLGDTYKATRQHHKGWRILKIALRNFRQLGDEIEVSHTLNNLGNAAYYHQDIDLALEYYQQALEIQRVHDLKPVMASTLNNIGSVYIQKCDFEQGQQYMKESLRLKETLNQPGEVARTMNNLGFVNVIIGEFTRAEDYLQRAEAINESIGAGDEWLINWINLLEVWISQAEYRKAIEKVPELFRCCDELDDAIYRIYIHVHLARCFHEIGDYRASQQHLEQAGSMMENVTDAPLMAKFFIIQADRRLLFKDKDGCCRALSTALEYAEKTGDPRERAEVYLAAAKAEKSLGEISPELSAPGEEAHRLFEKHAGRHRLFESLLITDDITLEMFLAEFPPPTGVNEWAENHYTGPPEQRGLWLWRMAKKALAEKQTRTAQDILTSLVAWSSKHETAELYWRAHTELGILYHAAHDYEMAARSFGAAFGQLQTIAQSIADPNDREAYLAGEDVARLNQQMQAFSARFAAKK